MQALKENLGSRLTVKIQVDHPGIVRIANERGPEFSPKYIINYLIVTS